MTRNTSQNRTDHGTDMHRRRLPFVALLLLLIAANQDPVIAKRGSDTLSLSQLRGLLADLPPDQRQRVDGDTRVLKDFIRNALLQRALLAQARSEKWDKRPDVRAALDRQRDALLAESFLTAQNAVPADFPSDREVQAAYEQNKARLLRPRRYKLVQLFAPKAATEKASRERLSELRARLVLRSEPISGRFAQDAGVQFVDMGWVAETALAPAIRPVITGLQIGAIADPVCMDGACHLLQLLDTQAAGPPPLSELHAALTAALRQQLQNEKKGAYASALLKRSPVMLDSDQLSRLNH